MKALLVPLVGCSFSMAVFGQVAQLNVAQYDSLKAIGALPAVFDLSYPTLDPPRVQPPTARERAGGDCNCWIEPDSTYILAMEPNDDLSSAAITLPFAFDLYGQRDSICFVNNNGNVSFLYPHTRYSAYGFPAPVFRMVAPFWGDVDTRAIGTVKYKLTANALYVNWVDVGYFSARTDKRNSFQLIISDGTNTDVGIGSNVSFCYKEMQWTTGSASCTPHPVYGTTCSNPEGTYSCDPSDGLELGFCGTPATVGANRGNGTDFVQFGRFNMPGTRYDGPFGYPDEVGWLSYKNFVFSTSVSSSNIAPVASGSSLCDTVRVCAGVPVELEVDFLSPEQGQITTADFSIDPPLSAPITVQNSGPGLTTTLRLDLTPTLTDTGSYVITYSATDNGVPPQTSTVSVVLQVSEVPTVAPVITGDTVVCPGRTVELTASGDHPFYEWSDGRTGRSIRVGPGTYRVSAGPMSCALLSDTFVVHAAQAPAPVIDGVLFSCGGQPTPLSTTEPYASYRWSTGERTATILAGTGTYTVDVTNDQGCTAVSAPVNVLVAADPTAYFMGEPDGAVPRGTTVIYSDRSEGNGGSVVAWSWRIDGVAAGTDSTLSITFDTPGFHPITLVVTTADGCTHTYTYVQVVLPEGIERPNVFTPNGDGINDALVFEGVQFHANASLQVMNRWGQEVFSSANYKNTWRPSKEIPEGTYYYILRLPDGKEYTGHVTLLR